MNTQAITGFADPAGSQDLLYAGLEADCDVAPFWELSPSVLLWRLTGWRCVTRRAFVMAWVSAFPTQEDRRFYLSGSKSVAVWQAARGKEGNCSVDEEFVDMWHDGHVTWPSSRT